MWKKISESIEDNNESEYFKETNIQKLVLGKIDYYGVGRRRNLAVVEVGFRYLKGNKDSYFTAVGDIWNNIHTDIVCGGAGTPEMLYKEFFPNDKLLKRIVELSDKWHLTNFSKIPEDARAEILDVLEQVKARSSSNV